MFKRYLTFRAVQISVWLALLWYAGSVSASSISVGWPHEKSDLKPDSAIVFGRLANGFRYVLLENTTPKNRVNLHLLIQSGSIHENDDERGAAHFLEHMMFNGTTHYQPGELVKFFQSIGMEFGPDANAHTSFLNTVYDIVLPLGNPESIRKGLVVMQDYFGGASLLEAEVERERKVILAEKRTRDSLSYRTFVATLNFELAGTLFPDRLPIGVDEVLEVIDRKTLRAFYDAWYRPENCVLFLVGDFQTTPVEPIIQELFAGLKARGEARPAPLYGEILHSGPKAFYHHEPEAGNVRVNIETLIQLKREPDSLSLRRQQSIENIGDQIIQNRLNDLLNQPETPFTSAAIGSGMFLNAFKYAYIDAACNPENWAETLMLLEQTLRKALTYGFTQAELGRVKLDMATHLDNAVKQSATRNSNLLASQLMDSVSSGKVFQSPAQTREILAPMLTDLTVESVQEAFVKKWSPAHRLILVTGNADLGELPEAKILSTFTASSAMEIPAPEDVKAVTFPYLKEPETAGRVLTRCETMDLGIIRLDFENGVSLNLKKTDFEANEVMVLVSFGGGRASEPKNLSGLSKLSEAVINESGPGGLSKAELERALAGKSTAVEFRVDEDSFVFKGTSVSHEIPLLFQLIQAYLTDLACRPEAYQLAMDRYRQHYRRWLNSVEGVMYLEGSRFLADGDGRFSLPSFDEFSSLTIAQIQHWILPALHHAPLEVSVIGDFQTDQVIAQAAKYLGTLAKRKPFPAFQDMTAGFPAAKTLSLSLKTKIPKGLVVIAYPTEDMWDIQRTRRLNILAGVFSERLRVIIREKLGAAYSADAFNRSSRAYKGYGVFQIWLHIKPEDAPSIITTVNAIADDLAQQGVSPDELRRTIDPMLTGIKDMQQKNNYWLERVLKGSATYPVQLDWSRTIVADFESVTIEEISAMAKTYLNMNKQAVIIITPETETSPSQP